jgi:hypothetical protein
VAKYLLLQCDNEEIADLIVKAIQEGNLGCYQENIGESDPPGWSQIFGGLKLRALFKKPTKFCECTNVKKRGFTRGQKYGWWVCDQCKRPTQGWARLELAYQVFGKNLLPPSEDAPEYRGDGNWGTWHRGS